MFFFKNELNSEKLTKMKDNTEKILEKLLQNSEKLN